MDKPFTLERLIADHNPADSKIYFSHIRYNYLNKNYTLAMEVAKEENDAQLEFFEGVTVELAIKAYYSWLNAEIDSQRDLHYELLQEEQDDKEQAERELEEQIEEENYIL